MHRDKYTEKIIRIVATIESQSLPVKVRELYVFGSYSRGVIEPGDLDLILVHDPPSRKYANRITAELEQQGVPWHELGTQMRRRYHADFRRPLRSPGERVQILFVNQLNEAVGEGSRISPSDPVLIWSRKDWRMKWRARLAAIVPNESAERAARNHLVSLARLDCYVGEMEIVVRMIEQQRLILTRIAIDSINLDLDAEHERRLARWTTFTIMGKKSMETLPYAMWWFQQQGKLCEPPDRTQIRCEDRTCHVEIGKPSLRRMLWEFKNESELERQCLIPHFKARDTNDLLVFERGPNWDEFRRGDADYDYFQWEPTAPGSTSRLFSNR